VSQVHKGFFESYGSLKQQVLDTLERMTFSRVRVTGHSLGAAMAVFGSIDIKVRGGGKRAHCAAQRGG